VNSNKVKPLQNAQTYTQEVQNKKVKTSKTTKELKQLKTTKQLNN